ncbi:MAG: 2,3-bisphosphoglycerate-independent phosphoglycerate mutase [Candidatus Dojkabacteria bacterium]|nr:2,3-bisphosphoglycerate-independent phosphoglycerate mutase [Candidatus Dojkabacteria bacterium]
MFNIFKKEEKKEERKRVLDVRKFVTLIVMDGFGIHPDPEGNAVLGAKTPFLDTAWTYGRSTLIHASGTHVGMPVEEPGNSEVGHLNLGAGQVVYQTLPRINDAITANELYSNPVIKEMFDIVKKRGSRLHLTGVLSAAGVHGHIKHLYSIMELCKISGIDPYIHVMLDGRDTAPKEGLLYVSKLEEKIKELGIGRIASIMGRFYGMDRDSRWERTKEAYDAMVGLAQETFTNPIEIVQKGYSLGENDEYFKPRMRVETDGNPTGMVKSGDAVLFWNFREDRARQLTKVFVMKEFEYFQRRNYPTDIYFATMTGYEENLTAHVVFPPLPVKKSLSEYLSENGRKQVHISETEKYMHVTYFFNGGIEAPHTGEDFFNVPSPRVDNYAVIPQMSAEKIRDEAVKRIKDISTNSYSFILMNFANPDMVGHTGDYKATVRANEVVDSCVQAVAMETLTMGGSVVITADHGNCETMINRVTKEIDIAHTNNPVPIILLTEIDEVRPKMGIPISRIGTGQKAKQTGLLADVAPTCLGLIGMEIPANMTGVDLRAVL